MTPPTWQPYVFVTLGNLSGAEEQGACHHNHSYSAFLLLLFVSPLCSHLSVITHFIFTLHPLPDAPLPFSLSVCLSVCLSLFLCFSLRLPLLWLTSSAVLRPLHEANTHSGLAVAACMRSTGGPIKRRQEQEAERDAGGPHPQGLRRYHHWPAPLPPPPPYDVHPSTLTSDLQALLCVSSGCCLNKPNNPNSIVCVCPPPLAALPTLIQINELPPLCSPHPTISTVLYVCECICAANCVPVCACKFCSAVTLECL